jgi:hypothetical protein
MKPELALQFSNGAGVASPSVNSAPSDSLIGGPKFRQTICAAFMFGADRDQNGVFEWRQVAAFPKLQLLLKVAREIVVPRKLDRWTKRRVAGQIRLF